MRLIAKAIRISRAKFIATAVQDIQDYVCVSHILGTYCTFNLFLD